MVGFDSQRNVKNVGYLMTLRPGSLPCLESIDVSHGHLSFNNLVVLLSAAPHLKYLRLAEFTFENTNLIYTIPPDCLLHMETLSLQHTTISVTYLFFLINAMPNLKEINLNGATIIEQPEWVHEPLRPRLCLEHLCLTNINIDVAILQYLMEAAPNLNSVACGSLKPELKLGLYFIYSALVISSAHPYSMRQLADIYLKGLTLSGVMMILPDYQLSYTLYSALGDDSRKSQALNALNKNTLMIGHHYNVASAEAYSHLRLNLNLAKMNPAFNIHLFLTVFTAANWHALQCLDLSSTTVYESELIQILNATPLSHVYN